MPGERLKAEIPCVQRLQYPNAASCITSVGAFVVSVRGSGWTCADRGLQTEMTEEELQFLLKNKQPNFECPNCRLVFILEGAPREGILPRQTATRMGIRCIKRA